MSVVEDINDAFEVRVASLLPDYSVLDFKYLIDKNSFYANKLRYGVTPSTSFQTPTTIKSITNTMGFTLTLTNDYVNVDNSDVDQQENVFALYDAIELVYPNVEGDKLGVPEILDITLGIIEAPLMLEDQKVIVLAAEFQIMYRVPLT